MKSMLCALLAAAVAGFAEVAIAAECPPIWISQSAQTLLVPPDANAPPSQTQLPDSPSQFGYVPAAVVNAAANANGVPGVNDTRAWCTDLAADAIANAAEVTNANVISKAGASFDDGTLVINEQSSVSGGGLAAQSSALVQLGFRDVLRAQAAGTELVPITLRRRVEGVWTLDGGEGGVLDRFIHRSFTLAIWERTETSFPQSWTRRLIIDDDDLNLLNGEQTYEFEVLPGKDLILSLYVYGQAGCIGNTTFGDPPVLYPDCYAFMDFGDEFGLPIELAFEPGPGVTLSSDAGFTNYVPEPAASALAAASLFTLLATRRSRG